MAGTVSLEWLAPEVGLLRYHPQGGSCQTRAPYTFVATVVRRGDRWELIGGVGEYSIAVRRLIRSTLNAAGIFAADMERCNGHRRVVSMR